MTAETISTYTGHQPFFSSNPCKDRDFLFSVNQGYPSMQALEQAIALLDELKTHILHYGMIHAKTPDGDFFPVASLAMLTETIMAIMDAVINGQDKPQAKEETLSEREGRHA